MIGLCCLQLHTIQHILICGGTEGVIQIWDLQLRQLLVSKLKCICLGASDALILVIKMIHNVQENL